MNEKIIESPNSSEKNYFLASQGARLLNFSIDLLVFMTITYAILISIFSLNPELKQQYIEFDNRSSVSWILKLSKWLIFIVSYSLMEFLLRGKTIGKFITKTRAVTENNKMLSIKDALLRSLYRMIPFEPFSFLGASLTGWHDRLSKTIVIKD